MNLRYAFSFLLVTAVAASAHGADPSAILVLESESAPAVTTRDNPFYCQPVWGGGVNASLGFGSEIADDIPDSLTGRLISQITLYMAEWVPGGYVVWTIPYGIAINFYESGCPPDQTPAATLVFDWTSLDAQLAYDNPNFMIVYEVTATLPSPVVISPAMSIGAYVINDWGENTPYCGFWFTPTDSVSGCGEAYWDFPGSAPRWTPFSQGGGYHADLACCLSGVPTSVPVAGAGSSEGRSWGEVKSLFR